MVNQSSYNFRAIEKKWQKNWETKKAFVSKDNAKGKKKYYVLDMFPYPSGEGLHMGHAFVFSLGDIYARFKRLQGFNVLYPIGYDSFGLPAENAAIKAGVHPRDYTKKSMANFMKQQKAMGWSYDWTRLVMAHDPEFYKWDQWIFLQMMEKGLAYRKKSAVNYCPKCETVLANEQVVQGMCWRHDDTKVEIRQLEQWYLATTIYAEELLKGLNNLDWPERAKLMQRNWIGRSEGAEILFEVEKPNSKISNVVIVHGSNHSEKSSKEGLPENERHWKPWIKKELEKKGINVSNIIYPKGWSPSYQEWKNEFEKNKINEDSILIGHSAGGGFLVRWLGETGRKVRKLILVAPAIIHSGSYKQLDNLLKFEINKKVKDNVKEIIIFVSDNDMKGIKESVEIFSKAFNILPVWLNEKGHFTLEDMGTEEFPELLNEITSNEKWLIFTTRPDTIYGVTFMVVSAQHAKLQELVTAKQKKEVDEFLKRIRSIKQEDIDKLDKEGVFTGSYAINPINNEKVPIYVGNFVVADYGSGMVMAVPGHDSRDYEFAKKYKLPIKEVIQPVYVNVSGSDAYRSNEPKVERKAVVVIIKNPKNNKHLLLQWKKNDWRGFVIGGVEAGEDLLTAAKREIEEETGYTDVKFIRKIEGVVHSRFYHEIKKQNREAHFETLYFELNSDKRKKISDEENKIHSIVWIDEDKVDEFLVRDNDILIIWKKFIGQECYEGSGTLINSGEFNDLESEEANEHIIKHLEEKKLGKKSVNYKLRDWLISRQRYWGTPIPVVYCETCGVVPVAEKDLPVKLPDKVKFGKGNPLLTNENWINTKCPKCKCKARRETDTMDTFANSSWYYLRYTDSRNKKMAFDPKKANYWCPIDQYIGGPEHITMHLIYIRFYAKFLRDLGLLKFDEPALKYFTQGVIKGSDGNRMSKSRGNVVEPQGTINKFGADSLRLFLMSASSPESDVNWDEKGIEGSYKFLNKVYEYFEKFKPGKIDARIESKMNKTIKEVSHFVEYFKHNLAIIKIRSLFNYISERQADKKTAEAFLQLLHIYCPFVTEELWQKIKGKGLISLSDWPVADESKIDADLEKQEEVVEGLINDLNNIKKFVKDSKKAYVYVIPNELEIYSAYFKDIEKRTNLNVSIFAVNDSRKYDPKEKSKKSKPNRPAIYLE